MPNFTKTPSEPGKKRKNIMKEFVIREISGVDFGAQEGARVVLMKRDDRPLEKAILLTSTEEGHQHSLDLDEWNLEQGGGHTREGYISEGDGHRHAFTFTEDGSIVIGESAGHIHTTDITGFLQRLKLTISVRESESVVQMHSPLVKSESGKDFGPMDFALVPNPEQPDTWKLRLTGSPGGNPDRRQIGNAVAALTTKQVPENERANVIRRVRTAWLKAHKGRPRADLPSVLKSVQSSN